MNYELIHGIWLTGLTIVFVADIVTRINKLQTDIEEIKEELPTSFASSFGNSLPNKVTEDLTKFKQEAHSHPTAYATPANYLPVKKKKVVRKGIYGPISQLQIDTINDVIVYVRNRKSIGMTMIEIAKAHNIGVPTLYSYIKSDGTLTEKAKRILEQGAK